MNDTFTLKSKVYAGKQSIRLLGELSGKSACIVCDSIMEELGYLGQVVGLLQKSGMSTAVFTGVRPDPDVKVVAAGLKVFQESGADVLVALGGGSAIDTAKGILYAARQYSGKAEEFVRPVFAAVPSTSGTGSEVTNFSVITAEGDKICVVDDYIAPDIAILDSTCIKHVPSKVVADTGIDVLVHALEAYVSTKATDFTDALAEKAVQLMFAHLGTLYQNPADSDARDRVQNASCMAGMAFTNSNLGINHSLAHALGGAFHIAHGRANALLMDAVMEFNADLGGRGGGAVYQRYAHLASLLHLPARTAREGCVNLFGAVRELKKSVGIEGGIRAAGIDRDAFEAALPHMASAALADRCTPTSPRQPTVEDVIKIYRASY